MKLISLKIGGFRNIENSKIILGDGMTSLVSENSYGKSNLIDAIDFATSFISVPPSAKSYMMELRSGIPLNKAIENNDFIADFVFETIFLGESYEVDYGFSFIWVKNDGGKKIQNEWLNIRRTNNVKKYSKLISRDDRSLFKASQSGRCSNVIKVADNELVLNKLLNYDNLYYMPIVEELNKLSIYVERHFDASSFYEKIPLVLKSNGNSTLLNMNDIPRAIHHLKEDYTDRYELLIDAFTQLFPNITDIEVREIDISRSHRIRIDKDAPYTIPDKVYSIYVKDKSLNQPLDFRSMSDGAKRVFLMLTAATIANIEDMTLIAFEEPENSIHPSLLQGYLRVLTQLAGDCNIIVSSHSPYIIDYVSTENVYIGKPNSCGLADFAKVDEKKVNRMEQDALKDEVSVGSYIFELLSGGKDEFDVLNTYLEK